MRRILLAYGTTDGHTARIAATVANKLKAMGAQVDVRTGQDALTNWLLPEDYEGVVVASSIHAGGFQRSVKTWVTHHHQALNARPTLFLPVCLAVLQKDPKVEAELRGIVDGFLKHAGWSPTVTRPVAGALLYTRYGWFKRMIMKRIARKAGGDTDTTKDWVYTDWKDLDRTVGAFYQAVAPPAESRTLAGAGSR